MSFPDLSATGLVINGVSFGSGSLIAWLLTYYLKVRTQTVQISKLEREVSNLDKDGVLKLAQIAKDIEERENKLRNAQLTASQSLANLRDALARESSNEEIRKLRDIACQKTLSDVPLAFHQYLRFKVLEFSDKYGLKEEFIRNSVIPEIEAWRRWLLALNNDKLFTQDQVSQKYKPHPRDYAELVTICANHTSKTTASLLRNEIEKLVDAN